jgi:hypothetical protein
MADVPTARRINRGSGHSYTLDGDKISGATTIIGDGFPKPALVGWAANVTADCVLDRWQELLELTPSERDKLLRRARFDHRDEAAERGKAAHTLIQRLTRGEEVEPSDELKGYVDAYLQFVKEWAPKEILVEAPIFSLEYHYAGTLDVIADLADGRRWLLDFKTGKNVYTDVALQLAAYRYADVYLDEDGELKPMVNVEACGVVWIQDGLYELRPVDAGPDAFAAFGAVQAVAAWRARNDDYKNPSDVIGAALQPPNGGRA